MIKYYIVEFRKVQLTTEKCMLPDPKKITILLVEDASSMRKIEIKILNSLGYANVIEAEDGAIAIKKLQEGDTIDLIISDWNMPNKGGYELLEWVRAFEKYKEVPFIMATAQADRSQAGKAQSAGVSSFIAKPFNADELKKKIEEAFGVREKQEAPAKGPRQGASGKVLLRVAHIQITDHLILGVLKDMIEAGEAQPKHFELETRCMSGWNPVEEALENGSVDAAFILAPIAMDLFNFGVPLKMVLFAHRNGSIFVRNQLGDYQQPYENFFRKKSVLIPHKMSVHHMLSHMFFEQIGLKASLDKDADVDVSLEVVAPINMPEFLKTNSQVSGFIVAEPIGSQSVAAGIAQKIFLSNELWQNHPCCVVTVRDDFSGPYEEAVFEFVEYLVKAGRFVETEPEISAEIAVNFLDPQKKLGLKSAVLTKVLTDPQGIRTGDLFPAHSDINTLQQYMHDKMGVGAIIDLEKFIDTRFAENACEDMVTRPAAIVASPEVAGEFLIRGGEPAMPIPSPPSPATAQAHTISITQEEGMFHFFLNR